MNYHYSVTMKQLLKKPSILILQIIVILSICLMVTIGIYDYRLSREEVNDEKSNPIVFDNRIQNEMTSMLHNNLEGKIKYSYSSYTPQFLSEAFASSMDNTINYCIAIDYEGYPCVVAIDSRDMDQYQELIQYTYSDAEGTPPIINMEGIPEEIEDDLGEISIEALEEFYGVKIDNTSSYSTMVGTLFLNTAKEPTGNYFITALCLIAAFALLILYIAKIVPIMQYRKRYKATLAKFGENDLINIDQELMQDTTICIRKHKLYITPNHLICKVRGLDIIPINDIVHVYGYVPFAALKQKKTIIAVTGDGVGHVIEVLPKNNNMENQIVGTLIQMNANIKCGFDDGFYTNSTTYSNINPDNSNMKSDALQPTGNAFLGIIGAILGAALGSILWILIGKLGFIAGIAGFVMAVFSIQGYTKLAGSIDRRGQLISIFIAMLMIFVANYTSYAIEICEANSDFSLSGIIDAYKRLPGLLTAAKLWGSFARDLVIGYLLSIWSCSKLIKAILAR